MRPLAERPMVPRPQVNDPWAAALTSALTKFFGEIVQRSNASITADGETPMIKPIRLQSVLVADLLPAAGWTGGFIFVSNEAGGAVPAFSDGTNWRRVTDRAIVS